MRLACTNYFRETILAPGEAPVPVPITAYQLVIAQWQALTTFFWQRNAPLVLLKLGLAFGLAQWLHNMRVYVISYTPPISDDYICQRFLLSGNICYLSALADSYLSPPWWQVILGALALATFTYLEGALIAALGVCSSLRLPGPRLRFSTILTFRLFLIAASLLVWVKLWTFEEAVNIRDVRAICFWSIPGCMYDNGGSPYLAGQEGYDVPSSFVAPIYRDSASFASSLTNDPTYMYGIVGEYLRLAAWTSVDGGVLMTGSVMRPAFGPLYILYVNGAFFLFSVVPYGLVIALFLGLARRFATRQGILPAPRVHWIKRAMEWL
jgi:hypothetical protein